MKVFAKDLKTYENTTLQYVGIMPKKLELKEYISVINSSNINSIIKNLKTVDLKTFEEGYITEITGNIPFFEIDYELNLKDDFNRLGIKDIFDINKTNLSNITNEQAYIRDSQNKTIINFSNDGIKAASAISYYGGGAGDCGFDYEFEVPVKTIYLTNTGIIKKI